MIGKRLAGSDAKWDVYLDIFTGLTWVLISLTVLLLTVGLVILSEKERSGKIIKKYLRILCSNYRTPNYHVEERLQVIHSILKRYTEDLRESELAVV